MADKLKDDKPAGIAATDLKRVVKDINRHKANASENSGLAGQATNQAVEQYSLDKKALSLVTGLVRKDDVAKAMSTLRAINEYAFKLGLFDQMDAFDDSIPIFKQIVERAENVRPTHGVPSGKADAVDDLLQTGADAPVH